MPQSNGAHTPQLLMPAQLEPRSAAREAITVRSPSTAAREQPLPATARGSVRSTSATTVSKSFQQGVFSQTEKTIYLDKHNLASFFSNIDNII